MAASATIGLLRVLLTANTAEFTAAMKHASDTAKEWSRDLRTIGQQASTIGASMTQFLTLPIVGVGAGAIKMASDFESSFAGVRKTVDATEPEFAALAQGLRDMAKEGPTNVNALNAVAEAAGQLGIKKDDILSFTQTMADLGVTTNLTADEAATATAQIQNIFGAAGRDTDRFGATLVALGNAGASTERDIVSMGMRIAGAGNQVGLTQAEVLSFASALSSVGIEAESGGTAISRTFLTINDAVQSGGKELDEFARIAGMSAAEFKEAFQNDAAGATVAFITGLARIKGEGENLNPVLQNLELGEIRVRDALLRASGAGELFTEQLKLGSQAWQDNTALTEEARKRYGTFASELARVWNQVKDLGITIGTALLPVFRDLVTTLQPMISVVATLAKWFAELPQPIRLVAVGMAGLVAAVGPVLYGFGQMAIAGSGLVQAFTAGGIATRALTFTFPALGAAASGAAIGVTLLKVALAGIGIGLVIVGLTLLIDKLKSVGKTVEDVTGQPIKGLLDANGKVVLTLNDAKKAASEFGGEIISGLQTPLILTADAMNQKTSPAAKTLTTALTETREEVKKLAQEQRQQLEVGRGFHALFVRLAPTVHDTGEEIRALGAAVQALPSDSSWVARTWVPFRAAVGEARTDVVSLGDTIRSSIGDALSNIPATLSRAFEGGGSIGGAFASIGVQLSQSISTAIMNGIEMSAPQLRRLNSTIQAGSAGAAAVGNAYGGQTAATIGSIAGSIGGAVLATTALGTAAATSATAALALGAATAGIGLAAVGVFMLAKHFLTVSKAVKEARADVLKFEDAIRDSLTEQQRMEAGGERWAEVLIGIRDAFIQTGRSAQEAERLTAQMWDTDNPDRAREAVAKIGVVFQELAVQQRMLAEGTEEANDIFQDLESQAALMGNTMPDALRPMIDRLVEMGVVTEETAERLGAIGNEGEVSLDAMKKAADEFGISLDTLGPTFQQQRLTEEAQRILTGINLLTQGGTDANVVLDGMQDELQAVVLESRRFGTEIPENMRPYLQSLVDSSELVDENGNKLTDLSSLKFGPPIADQWQIITDKLSTLIDKITAALPRALDEFALKTDQATAGASHDFGTVIGKVNALGQAIRMLPEMPSGDMPDVPTYTPVESYARGSRGIRDFGAGTLAMLHGREGVYTESQIAAMRAEAPVVNLNTATTDRTLQELLRMMRKLPKDIKLGMREAMVMA